MTGAFQDEWDDGYRYRQFMHQGYDVDEDFMAFEKLRYDSETPKEWDCCYKSEENPGCMVSQHKNSALAAKSSKMKH